MNTFIWSLLDDHKVKFEKKKKQNQKNKQTKNTNFYEEREHTMTNSSFFFFLELGKCPKEFNSSKLPYNWKSNWLRLIKYKRSCVFIADVVAVA